MIGNFIKGVSKMTKCIICIMKHDTYLQSLTQSYTLRNICSLRGARKKRILMAIQDSQLKIVIHFAFEQRSTSGLI